MIAKVPYIGDQQIQAERYEAQSSFDMLKVRNGIMETEAVKRAGQMIQC
jgi:hypothetical protein